MRKIIIFSLLATFSFFILNPVNAALMNPDKITEIDNNVDIIASSTDYSTERTLEDIIATIIRVVTSILGTIFLILAFVAGNNWMQAAGNEEKAKKSKETIRDLIIGVAIVIIVYALASGMGGMISGLLLAK
jgi:small-conductance mechanosensitive channel